MKNKELFDRANADGDKELQAKLRNDFAEWCKRSGACEKTEGSKNDVRRDVAES